MDDFTWTQTRDTVQAAIAKAAGLPGSSVIWKYQPGDQPDDPYIAMTIGKSKRRGRDYLVRTYDKARPPAQAIEVATRGLREVSLELEGFTESVADKDDALALLERVRSSLLLPSIRGIMKKVSFTPFGPGDVDYVPTIVSTGFRGRSVLSIRSYMPAAVVREYVTWIESLQVTLKVTENGQVVKTVEVPVDLDE